VPLAWKEPFATALALRDEPGLVLLESRPGFGDAGSRSLLAVRPLRIATESLSELDSGSGLLRAGWISYDAGREIERLPERADDDRALPALALGHYEAWLEFDHLARSVTLHGGGGRAAVLRDALAGSGPAVTPHHCEPELWTSSLPRPDYEQAVREAIDYIRAGDMFQVNISQRFSTAWEGDAFALYARLREQAPAPFMGLADLGGARVISASPELFLRGRGRRIETRPIKGTRPRGETPARDHELAASLVRSEKDRAENVMIVDLARNDLGRVCDYGSVSVERLCGLESHAGVHHLVSTISGEMREGVTPEQVVRATFPPGSVTGAPKIRAMEIIEELEPVRRGAYCGSLAWFEPGGDFDLSVAIRTFIATPGRLDLHAGGAIVAGSDPHGEWRESMHKAAPLLAAAGGQLAGGSMPVAAGPST